MDYVAGFPGEGVKRQQGGEKTAIFSAWAKIVTW